MERDPPRDLSLIVALWLSSIATMLVSSTWDLISGLTYGPWENLESD